MSERRTVGVTLFLCLAASQSSLLVLTPVLAGVASDFGVSTAIAGQLRTLSGLAAGATAVLTGLAATRVGLRELLLGSLALIAGGSALSAAAPDLAVLALAQVAIGAGIGFSYSAGLAAVAEWSRPEERSNVLAAALLGPPTAWVIGMPLAGIVGGVSWRLVWIAVPLALSVIAAAVVMRRSSTAPASTRADLRAVLAHPGVLRWSSGELLAFSAWAGSLVFVGALFVETYGLSERATGFALGVGALVYLPGNFFFRRFLAEHEAVLLVLLPLAAAVAVALLGVVRPSAWFSLVVFAVLSFIAGGRTLAGSARGIELAPALRLGVMGIRTAALQLGYFVGAAAGGIALAAGGYDALGLTFAAIFVGAALPHVKGVAAMRAADRTTG